MMPLQNLRIDFLPVRRPARFGSADVRHRPAADRVRGLGEGGQGARDDRRHLQGQSGGEFSGGRGPVVLIETMCINNARI